MSKLTTNYLGLKLRNPIIVGSSGLTSSLDSMKKLEQSGAGALVVKSLFEEQIRHEAHSLSLANDYPEAYDYLQGYVSSNNVEAYLDLIAKAKQELGIPIIASINCFSASQWVDFANRIQGAGADALEVNVFKIPKDPNKPGANYEEVYLTLAEKLSQRITIPLSFKLGNYFTNPLNIIQQLLFRKVRGVVLFNRFYAPDIDINDMRLKAAEIFSNPSDIRSSLRWVGMTSHLLPQIDISASTGVHNGEALVKMLLAGATTVQVCSVLYQKGPQHLTTMLDFLNGWMDKKKIESIVKIRGALNYGKVGDATVYERSQFMKYYSSHD